MKLKVQPDKKIEDGRHEGVIVAVEYREKPFEYTDLVIEFEGGKRIKYGVPTAMSPSSKLGRLVEEFTGNDPIVGGEIDPDIVFINQKCSFQTITTGKFSNVVKDSVRRLKK